MKVGVLGSGTVGQTLASAFVDQKHQVMLGARDAKNEKTNAWAKKADGKAGTFADTAAFGEIIVLATEGMANPEVLKAAKEENLRAKIIIDATNPLEHSTGRPLLAISGHDSGGERVQKQVPSAHVVKCFNTVGAAHMYKPKFTEGRPDMFICGNDEEAKKVVTAMLGDFGWGVVDLGSIEGSRYLEAMCMAWVVYGLKSGTWNHAFKLLRH